MISSDMPLVKFTSQSVFFLAKLIGAIIIFYVGITYYVLDVGEPFVSDQLSVTGVAVRGSESGNVVEQYIDEAIEEIKTVKDDGIFSGTQGHFAANIVDDASYKNKFDTICLSDRYLCEKIDFVGDYTLKDKFIYLSSVFKVVHFLQKSMLVGNDIIKTLSTMLIDNSVGTRRGYATWDEVVLNLGSVQSKAEFLQLLAHELGHIVDLGSLQGISDKKHGAFTEFGKKVFASDDFSLDYYAISWKSEKIRKSTAGKKDFCSGYGMSDPFEDFAECFNLYLYHNSLFKTIAKGNENLKKKYNFIASVLDGKYITTSPDDLLYIQQDKGWRPWDTTRIGG